MTGQRLGATLKQMTSISFESLGRTILNYNTPAVTFVRCFSVCWIICLSRAFSNSNVMVFCVITFSRLSKKRLSYCWSNCLLRVVSCMMSSGVVGGRYCLGIVLLVYILF